MKSPLLPRIVPKLSVRQLLPWLSRVFTIDERQQADHPCVKPQIRVVMQAAPLNRLNNKESVPANMTQFETVRGVLRKMIRLGEYHN